MAKKKDEWRTSIDKHTRDGKSLKPPFSKLVGMHFSSWKDERMPEMLWAVVVTNLSNRDTAIRYFRYVLGYIQKTGDIEDLTLTGIDKLDDAKKESLIMHMCSFSSDVNIQLRKLLLFDALPSKEIWGRHLSNPIRDEDWNTLATTIIDQLDHQSQKATDCRWVKLMGMVLAGKLKFPREMEGKVEALFEYPNKGDMREIGPFIRASEIGFQPDESNWSKAFWDECQVKTHCFEIGKAEVPKETLQISDRQLSILWNYLISYYHHTDKGTFIEAKHDTVFGTALLSVRLLREQVVTNLSRGALARIVLRTLCEMHITLAYLIKKNDDELWKKFRNYGIGQIKLTSLKFNEGLLDVGYLDEDMVREYANEDRWEEYTEIDLGHWDKKDLRSMSIEADCKDIYDKFYQWPSAYSHGSWAAIRESTMTKCGNPLHRLHHIPAEGVAPMHSTLSDAVGLVNGILDLLEKVYPDFDLRLEDELKMFRKLLLLTLVEIQKMESNTPSKE